MVEGIAKTKKYEIYSMQKRLDGLLRDLNRGHDKDNVREFTDYEIEDYKRMKKSDIKQELQRITKAGLDSHLTYEETNSLKNLGLM